MTTLCNSSGSSLHALQAWAFERLVALDLASGDLRLAIIALLSRVITAAGNALFETIASRALQGARFAGGMAAADTMVAAASR